jgi:hypothetical protein
MNVWDNNTIKEIDSKNLNICLIGGTGRSGTTILKKIFIKHPTVANIPEWRCLIDPDGLIDFYNTISNGWSPYLYDIKLKRLKKKLIQAGRDGFFKKGLSVINDVGFLSRFPYRLAPCYSGLNMVRYCPNYFQIVDKLISDLTDFKYRGQWIGMEMWEKKSLVFKEDIEEKTLAYILGNFYRKIIEDIFDFQKAKNYVEDNTWTILWFDKILNILPEAKLVHIYRDPRDVVSSFLHQSWCPSNLIEATKWYKSIIKRWLKLKNQIAKNAYMEISLESLVAKPKDTIKKICDFWNIEYNSSILNIDLSRSHSGRWKKDLNKDQQNNLEYLLKDELQCFGYI